RGVGLALPHVDCQTRDQCGAVLPTYAYACTECGHEFEVVQSITDPTLTACERCSGPVRKVFHPVGVTFKGSGFYRTDSRAGGGSTSSANTGDGSKSSDKKSGEKKAADSSSSGSSDKSSGSSGSSSGSSDKSSASNKPSSTSTKSSGASTN
ncbi:MAG: FmdB family zinc ribbon protein, partial [Actinomycetes bacterium]